MHRQFRPREYHRPKDIQTAVELLSGYGKRAKIIAGGTELLVHQPLDIECLVDLSNLNLNYIKKEGESILIGASTTLSEIESSPLLSSEPYRVLSEAASAIATPTIRNTATVGGNLCNASPAVDLPPALMVLDATVKVASSRGSRVLPVADLFKGVKKTVLSDEEFLIEVQISTNLINSGAAFQKLTHHQTSIDIAIVNAATRLTIEKKVCEDVRIALGAVAPTPIYAKGAEMLLKGKKLDGEVIQRAAEAASKEAKPIDDIRASAEYRKKMVAVLVRRALEQSAGRCRTWEQ